MFSKADINTFQEDIFPPLELENLVGICFGVRVTHLHPQLSKPKALGSRDMSIKTGKGVEELED